MDAKRTRGADEVPTVVMLHACSTAGCTAEGGVLAQLRGERPETPLNVPQYIARALPGTTAIGWGPPIYYTQAAGRDAAPARSESRAPALSAGSLAGHAS